jgi:type 1 glutamine amidotransferase
MRVLIVAFACIAALVGGGPVSRNTGEAVHRHDGVSGAAAPVSKRLLYITLSAGYHHEVVPLSAKILKDIGAGAGFDVTATDDVSGITSEGLKQYSAIAFYTTGELPMSDDQKQAMLNFVKSGKGFLGFHSATDTFYKWPDYGEMIGGYFDGHPWHQEVSVKVEDARNPATRHLGNSFVVNDEIYQFRNFSRDRVHVLLTLDTKSVDMTKKLVHRTDGDFALAWCREYGKGRVFYTALGHEPAVWQDERFQKMVIGAMNWVTGQVK